MTTLESTETRPTTRRSRRLAPLIAVVAFVVVAGIALFVRIMTDDQGPVPADVAQVDITFSGDGTTFVGDRKIIEGTVTVAFSNETDGRAIMAILVYETGSAALAEELAFIPEGSSVVTSDAPTAGYSEVDFEGQNELMPGSHVWPMDLEAGNTYLIDVGPEGFHTKGLWRAAVIEVFAE